MKIGNLKVYGVIYKIENLKNGKVYIGQTIQNGGFDRRYENKLEVNTHNKHLKRSIKKYGIENFKIYKIFDIAFSREELNIKEKLWINFFDSYKNGYNQTLGGEGSNGFSHTEETKKKMSENNKGENNPNYGKTGEQSPMYGKHHSKETKEKIGNLEKGELSVWYGKHHTKETKLKISESHKGKTLSEETKNKISISQKGKKKHTNEWKQYLSDSRSGENHPMYNKHHDDETRKKISQSCSKKVICLNDLKIFNSIKEASEYYNCNRGDIGKVCKGKKLHIKQFKFMYYDDYLNL